MTIKPISRGVRDRSGGGFRKRRLFRIRVCQRRTRNREFSPRWALKIGTHRPLFLERTQRGAKTRLFLRKNGQFFGDRISAPQRMAVQGTHQRIVPSSSLQRAPRYRFVAWRFRSSGYPAHRWTVQEERKSLEWGHGLTVFFPFTTYTPAGKCFHAPRTRLPCSV